MAPEPTERVTHTDRGESTERLDRHTSIERLGPYRLVARLGEGGMGVVHLGLDRHGRAVAIKVLRPHIAYDRDARWRLEREVDTLQRIRSDRVAAVVDHDIVGDQPYLVTRYVAGPSLDDVVTDEGALSPTELVLLGRGLVEALEAIHAVGVVHRDLKPGNVLLEDGEPVVIDFGIAHVADDVRLTSSGLVMGTPGYLSPEIVGGSAVTQATDWWGWAATVAFAASGHPPFGRGPMDVVLGRVTRGECDLTGADPRLVPVLTAGLSPDPDRRPPAREIVAALERYASGRSATVSFAPGAGSVDVTSALPETGPVDGRATAPPPTFDPYTSLPGWATAPPPVAEPPAEGFWDRGPGPDAYPHPPASWPEPPGDWRPPEADPRIGQPARTGSLLAVAAVLTAAAASWPGVAVLVAVLWCWLARFGDRWATALVMRRYYHGRRRSDVPQAVLASPWHLAAAALSTVLGLVLPHLVAVAAAFCAALGLSALTASTLTPAAPGPLAVGFLVGTSTAWWGAGGAALRRGSRSLVRGVAPGALGAAVAVSVLVLATTVLVGLVVARHGEVSWWPFPWAR